MANMTKPEMVKALAKRLEVSKVFAEDVFETVFGSEGIVIDSLLNGNKVKIMGFGSFGVTDRKSRTARNPKTGQKVQVPARRVPTFRFSKALKEAIRK